MDHRSDDGDGPGAEAVGRHSGQWREREHAGDVDADDEPDDGQLGVPVAHQVMNRYHAI